jgi:hypothetical protein
MRFGFSPDRLMHCFGAVVRASTIRLAKLLIQTQHAAVNVGEIGLLLGPCAGGAPRLHRVRVGRARRYTSWAVKHIGAC